MALGYKYIAKLAVSVKDVMETQMKQMFLSTRPLFADYIDGLVQERRNSIANVHRYDNIFRWRPTQLHISGVL